jgi:hypothetical protein
MLKVEKITLLVSSDTGNQAFDRIISMVQEGELMGEYKLINYENPTEYTLIQSKHEN